MLSNYHGRNDYVNTHSPLMVAQAHSKATGAFGVTYSRGCNICDYPYSKNPGFPNNPCPDGKATDTSMIAAAAATAQEASVAVLFLGSDQTTEAENFDRNNATLPGVQEQLLKAVLAVQPRTVVVLLHGGPVASEQMKDSAGAIIDAYYPGEMGGQAILDTLLGDNNPAGALPYTMYHSNFTDHRDVREVNLRAGTGITHQWFDGPVLYPFSWGMSYTSFDVAWEGVATPGVTAHGGTMHVDAAALVRASNGTDAVSFPALHYQLTVRNTGERAGDWVGMVFVVRTAKSPANFPLQKLVSFSRAKAIGPGESRTLVLTSALRHLTTVHGNGQRWMAPAEYALRLGNSQSAVEGKLVVHGPSIMLGQAVPQDLLR
jgi:beta-D-xylosidase 4